MINTLKKLVSFKTTHEPGHEPEFRKLFDFVVKQIKGCGVTHKFVTSGGHRSLIISKGKALTKQPKVRLMMHIDVVPASAKMFTAREQGGKLFGRGVIDDKFATAACLELIRELRRESLDFGAIITAEEEIGGQHGAQHVLKLGYRGQIFVVPDGGEDLSIEYEAKGVLHLEVRAQGQAAHGSQPWLGQNALDLLLGGYERLRKIFPETKRESWGPTLNLGKIEGGRAVNQVPDTAVMFLDFRYPISYRNGRARILRAVRQSFRGCVVRIESEGGPFSTNPHHPAVQSWIETVQQVTKRTPKLERSYGATDARYLTPYKIPAIITYPQGGGLHTEQEWLDLKSFRQFYEVLRSYVRKMA